MRTRVSKLAAVAGLSLLGAVPASSLAQPVPDHASCDAFGAHVATLAQTLGGDFGQTASTVASSAPGVFPQAVVQPEQTALCDPR